ncbi:MAG: Gfo/Idh/MocA family oxidoreductase [Lachnospiraceae bacterium]|nr:Gfo/Idh/MocA family oxidoreductase [Lachnospiraceae bacterium]
MMERTKSRIRVALIGVGGMGRKYAEMIAAGKVPSMELTALVCRNDQARAWAQGLSGQHAVFADTDALYAHPELYGAVLIVTPHRTHPELALKVFALGKHVLCDKPAGVAASQAQAMAEAAESKNLIYGMIFHQRLYPKYRKIKEILDSGDLGKLSRILLVNTRYFRTEFYHHSGSWRSSWNGEGGGVLINQGQHILDIWQWLFGMPQKLTAQIPFGKYNDFLVDDEAIIMMSYPDDLTALFLLTTGEAVHQERLEMTGSKGKILMEDDTLHIWHYGDDSRHYAKTAQVTDGKLLDITQEVISFEKKDEPYPQMLENFAQAVLAGDSSLLIAPGADAVNPLMLTNAAYLSAWKGESVALPIDEKEYDVCLAEICQKEAENEIQRSDRMQ